MIKKPYNDAFYGSQSSDSSTSAGEVVPYLAGLLQPKSVVDVGCGVGTWLAQFKQAGVDDLVGIDGHWVRETAFRLPYSQFQCENLERPADIRIDRRFDLAISMEVGEHISGDKAGELIEFMTSLSDIVIFSAAIPGQGGRNHVNEQWPDYWLALIEERGYRCFDVIRQKFWDNPQVSYYYAQNAFLYMKLGVPDVMERRVGREQSQGFPLRAVHPMKFTKHADLKVGPKALLKALPGALINKARRIKDGQP